MKRRMTRERDFLEHPRSRTSLWRLKMILRKKTMSLRQPKSKRMVKRQGLKASTFLSTKDVIFKVSDPVEDETAIDSDEF